MTEQDVIERMSRGTQDAAIRLQVRSALNPLLWLCAISTPVAYSFAFFSDGFMQLGLLVTGSLPVISACGAYIYLMVVSPERLHSEDYQLRRQALQMIHEKGARVGVLASSVLAITNPNAPRLPEDSK